MWLKNIKGNKSCLFLLLTIGIAFLILNILTPEYLDDYLYKYTFINGIADKDHPILTLKDIYVSQLDHYFTFNGRVIIHSFVQLFCGILGKGLFNFANAIIFTYFIFLSVKYTQKSLNTTSILLSTCIALICFPCFRDTFLWMTGSINYLWTATFTLMFLYLLKTQKGEIQKSKTFVFIPLGIFLGWAHEGISFPLALSCIIYCIFNRKTVIKNAIFPLILGYILGAFMCTFSPATLGRASTSTELSIGILAGKVLSGFMLCSKLKVFYILLIGLLYTLYRQGKKQVKDFINNHILLFGAIFFSFGIVFLSGFTSSRTAFGLELFSFLLTLCLFKTYYSLLKLKSLTILSLITLYGIILVYSISNYNEYSSLLTQIKNPRTNIITTNEKNYGIFESFIRKPLIDNKSEYYFSFSPDFWENQYISHTYNKDYLIFLPNEFISQINTNKFDSFYTTNTLPFYVKKIDSKENISKVSFLLNEIDYSNIPFYIKPFAHKLDRYTLRELTTNRYSISFIDDNYYLFVKKNSYIDNRVSHINVQ